MTGRLKRKATTMIAAPSSADCGALERSARREPSIGGTDPLGPKHAFCVLHQSRKLAALFRFAAETLKQNAIQ